ncbi:MAG TPA: PEGA domain-containing protein [Verrucomicrobiae bacterium]|nr:PEGA domain-containing protein [Verrucomicrobiae bacterium]
MRGGLPLPRNLQKLKKEEAERFGCTHKYVLQEVLGRRGGFGITYLARSGSLKKLVAVKELMPLDIARRAANGVGVTAHDGRGIHFDWAKERFLTEATILAKFSSDPRIVTVHDVFIENNTAYMVMDYLKGQTLEQWIEGLGAETDSRWHWNEQVTLSTTVFSDLAEDLERWLEERFRGGQEMPGGLEQFGRFDDGRWLWASGRSPTRETLERLLAVIPNWVDPQRGQVRPPVKDFGEWRGIWKWNAKRPPDEAKLRDFFGQILTALECIHGQEPMLLHRDIKPSNLYLCQESGLVVLLDFGSARYVFKEETGTVTRMATDGFAPPEQYLEDQKQLGRYTDIYAVAATFSWLMRRERPPTAISRTLGDTYQPLSADQRLTFHYSRSFLECIDWGMRLSPKDRPETVQAWRDWLSARDREELERQKRAQQRPGGGAIGVGNLPPQGATSVTPALQDANASVWGWLKARLGGMGLIRGVRGAWGNLWRRDNPAAVPLAFVLLIGVVGLIGVWWARSTGGSTDEGGSGPQGTGTVEGPMTNVPVPPIVEPRPPMVGEVVLESVPSDAHVFDENGRQLGITPYRRTDVAPGSHAFRLEPPAGLGLGMTSVVVRVSAGATKRLEVRWPEPTGSLRIESDPVACDVYVDGDHKGKTPKAVTDLASGTHLVRLTDNQSGASTNFAVQIEPGREMRRDIILRAAGPSEAEVKAFARKYFEEGARRGIEEEVGMYAARVDNYFGDRGVNQAFIREDRRRFCERWPTRKYTIISGPNVRRAGGEVYEATAEIRYELDDGQDRTWGKVRDEMGIRVVGGSLQITSIASTPIETLSLEDRVREFVRRYYSAGNSHDDAGGALPALGQLGFFSDTVDYFDDKGIGPSFIRDDLTKYAGDWPRRSFCPEGQIDVTPGQGGEFRVTLWMRYRAWGSTKKKDHGGRAHDQIVVRLAEGRLRITSIKRIGNK